METFFSNKAKEIFGNSYVVTSLERLLGGAQKHTWLARCSNRFSFVIYQWGNNTSYFNTENDIFQSSSAELFELNNQFMLKNGVLTPKLYHINATQNEQSYKYAFVEYIDGCDFDNLLVNEPERATFALKSLNESIINMHALHNSQPGQLGRLLPSDFDYTDYTLKNIFSDISYLKEYDSDYNLQYSIIKEIAFELKTRLKQRQKYTFIHFELGPNHVMVDKMNNAYVIDIEGARFCDVEEENSLLEIRFGKNKFQTNDNVDPLRMQFYHIGHCIGFLKGAVELSKTDYYDMDDVKGMINFYHNQIKQIVPA